MRLLVVRHGRTDWNNLKKIQGAADIELNEEGIKQAEEVSQKLANEKIDLIISSPLKRTRKTSKIINKGRNIKIIYDDRIKERDYGEFEGLQKSDFNYIDFWTYSKNLKYEKAENIQDFFKRVYEFLDEVKEKYKDKTVLIVIHGGVSVIVNSYFNGMPPEGTPTKGAFKNCEVKEYFL